MLRRALDRRPVVVLAYGGEPRFHTTSVDNLAEVVALAADRPGKRVLNSGDPDPPTPLEITRLIAAWADHAWIEVLLPGSPKGEVGDSPWSGARSVVVDMRRAEEELGYRPVTTYAAALEKTCEWLVAHPERALDYRDEDDWLGNFGSRAS